MDASGRRIFTTNIVDGTLSEIDPGGSRFVRTIEVAPMIEGLTITPDGSQIWVGSNEARTVSGRISARQVREDPEAADGRRGRRGRIGRRGGRRVRRRGRDR